MNHQQFRKERRRFVSTEPRVNFAANTVTNNCVLVRRYSFAHAALIAQGFEELTAENDCALMRAPHGFEVAQIREERLPC